MQTIPSLDNFQLLELHIYSTTVASFASYSMTCGGCDNVYTHNEMKQSYTNELVKMYIP